MSRVARKNEVLVSLSGSPVVGVTAKATKAEEEQAVLVPLGKGETLCVPMGQDSDSNCPKKIAFDIMFFVVNSKGIY